MRGLVGIFIGIGTIIIFASYSNSTLIVTGSSSISFDDSWDSNPPGTIIDYLEINGGNDTYTLLNGFDPDFEYWTGTSAATVIIEEFAGFAPYTTFGWYCAGDPNDSYEIFAGSDSKGASQTIDFGSTIDFGFYIEPNGSGNDRFYTEREFNPKQDYQVTIFQVNNSNEYILGWEDLALSGGDKDYQDMIVRATINPVPEPGKMLLFGTGLACLARIGYRRKKK